MSQQARPFSNSRVNTSMTALRIDEPPSKNMTTAQWLQSIDNCALTAAIRALLPREVRNIIYTHVLEEPAMS
jgi:hypothetical protein